MRSRRPGERWRSCIRWSPGFSRCGDERARDEDRLKPGLQRISSIPSKLGEVYNRASVLRRNQCAREISMSRQLSRQQAVVLGIVILLGLGLGSWVLVRLQDAHGLGGDVFHVEAGFADIGGVEVGTRVRVQGID